MNPFVEDHVDEDSPPLDLDAFIGGELTPRRLVASLVRRAALKAAAGEGEEEDDEDERSVAIVVAEAMKASMMISQPSRASSKHSAISLPPPTPLLLEHIIREFER
jgi:hypothetical protein